MNPITTFTYEFDELPLALPDGRMIDALVTGEVDVDVYGIEWWQFGDDLRVRSVDGSMIWLHPSDPLFRMVMGALEAQPSSGIDALALDAYDRAREPDWDRIRDDRIAMREIGR